MPYDSSMTPLETNRLSPAIPQASDPLEPARHKLIVALDVPTAEAASKLVDRMEGACKWFKIGLELFVGAGPAVVETVLGRGYSVFLDLKFHDIPNTVAGAVRSAARLGVGIVNVHASGGPAMLTAAKEALAEFPHPPELLAVTMLTSMDQAQMNAAGLNRSPAEEVELLARMSLQAGVRGFVCSAQEVSKLRSLTGPEGVLVVPGIRPAGAAVGDQKRVATPAEALRQGASYIVVGRPITQAPDPAKAAEAILEEMAAALPLR